MTARRSATLGKRAAIRCSHALSIGDLALERGEFEVAEHYWRMLAGYPSEAGRKLRPGSLELRYPAGDGALAQAKLILALIFRGEKDAARSELEQFRKLRPDATGQ